jgi:hypothetical protein
MQTIGCLLLQGTNISVKAEDSVIRSMDGDSENAVNATEDSQPPGRITWLTHYVVTICFPRDDAVSVYTICPYATELSL